MKTVQAAQFLASSLRLGSTETEFRAPEGALDRALFRVVKDDAAPSWLAAHLHFAKTRVGLRCVELDEILAEAQGLGLTEAPNPSYLKVILKADVELARDLIIEDLGMSVDDAEAFGKRLWLYLREEATQAPASA